MDPVSRQFKGPVNGEVYQVYLYPGHIHPHFKLQYLLYFLVVNYRSTIM